jgi:hypothetical protein
MGVCGVVGTTTGRCFHRNIVPNHQLKHDPLYVGSFNRQWPPPVSTDLALLMPYGHIVAIALVNTDDHEDAAAMPASQIAFLGCAYEKTLDRDLVVAKHEALFRWGFPIVHDSA